MAQNGQKQALMLLKQGPMLLKLPPMLFSEGRMLGIFPRVSGRKSAISAQESRFFKKIQLFLLRANYKKMLKFQNTRFCQKMFLFVGGIS